MTTWTYALGCRNLEANWTSSTYEVMLLLGSFFPDPGSQQFAGDISGDELSAGTYARATITSPAINPGDNRAEYDADDADFGSPTGAELAAWAALIEVVTNDADSPIVAVYPVARTTDGTPLTVAPPPTGWVALLGSQ